MLTIPDQLIVTGTLLYTALRTVSRRKSTQDIARIIALIVILHESLNYSSYVEMILKSH